MFGSSEIGIKSLSAEQIAIAIAAAVSELTGKEYKADIQSIDFEPFHDADDHDAVDIKLRISSGS